MANPTADPTYYSGVLETSGTAGRGSKTVVNDVADIYPDREPDAERDYEPDPDGVLAPGARSIEADWDPNEERPALRGDEVPTDAAGVRRIVEGKVIPTDPPSPKTLRPERAEVPQSGNIDTTTGAPSPVGIQTVPPPDGEPEGDWYEDEGVTKDDLSDELERRDLPKTGNKDELIARLREDDDSDDE